MKKILTAAVAIAMGATLVGAFVACGGSNKNAEIAESAIGSIQGLYGRPEDSETTGSFKVLGKTSVESKLYDVTWSVSSDDVEDITQYIQIGTEMDEDYRITINVERSQTLDIAYTLTASVTVGKVTKTCDIPKTLLKLGKIYTADEILALDQANFNVNIQNGSTTSTYYSEDGTTAAVVVVKGYVVDPGSYASNYKNYEKIYIADAADETASAKKLYVYRVQPDGVYLKDDGSTLLKAGDLVTFQGCVSIYNSKIQITYAGDVSVKCIGLVRNSKSDAELAQAAVDTVTLEADLTSNLTVTLPSAKGDATLTWTVKAGGATIDGYKLTCPENTADTAKDVTLTVTADVNGATASKDITVKVAKVADFTVGTYKMSVVQESLTGSPKLYFKGTINSSNFGETSKNVADAADIVVTIAPGGYYLKVDGKYLELNATHRMTLVNAPTSAWVYNTGLGGGTFTWYVAGDNAMYYLGTYGTFETISASAVSYFTATGNFHVAFTVETDTRTDDEIIAAAKSALELDRTSYTEVTDVTLPTTKSGANVAWTLGGGTSEYVELSADNDSCTLKIKSLPAEETSITLVATITKGEGTQQTKSFTIKVVDPANVNYGTLEAPLSVAEALDLATLQVELTGEWTKQVVYMTGKVTVIDENNVTVADLSNSNKTIVVYKSNLKAGVDALIQNDVVTVSGYITSFKYNDPGKPAANGTIEFSQNGETLVYIENKTPGTSTITLGVHNGATVTGLSESAVNGSNVLFTVAVESGYELVAVKVNGTAIEASEGSYSFTVAGNTTVTVETKEEGAAEATVLYTLTTSTTGSNNSYAGSCDVTVENATWNIEGNSAMNPWRFGGKSITSTDRKLTGKTAIAGNITKLEIAFGAATATVNSIILKVYSSDPTVDGATPVSTITITDYAKDKTVTVMADANWTNCYYQLVFNVTCGGSNQYVTVSTIKFIGYTATEATEGTGSENGNEATEAKLYEE